MTRGGDITARERVERLKARARQLELVFLVWGPGEPSPDADDLAHKLWKKRLDVRTTLSQAFPNASVAFSEDEPFGENTAEFDDPLERELVEASAADCIFVLDVARGVHVEVDTFVHYPSIAAKMIVFLPQEHLGKGLAAGIHSKLRRVVGFSEEELAECRVAKKCDTLALSRAIESILRS